MIKTDPVFERVNFEPPHKIYLAKLSIISSIFLLTFFYLAGFVFPGGAIHYTDWAQAIHGGGTLPLGHAQREVGLPLLYLLTGLVHFKSFIGPTIAYGLFGVAVILMNYLATSAYSKRWSYISSIFLIFTFAPFEYLKFFYPDQLYVFGYQCLGLFIVLFIWTEKKVFIYLLTLSAMLVSLTRTSGTLLFAITIVCLMLYSRKHWKSFIFCIALASVGYFLNQSHRYEVFDLANRTETKPVGKGYQILYSTYMYMGQFGYKISPELGPNSKLLIERMREEFAPSPKQSKLLSNPGNQTPQSFMDEYVYQYTSEELIDKILSEPGEEYFNQIILRLKRDGGFTFSSDIDDEFMLDIAREIWMGYPLYIVRYGLRNLGLMLFDPGWSNPRYTKGQWVRQGLPFVAGERGWGLYSVDSAAAIGEAAERELELNTYALAPKLGQDLLDRLRGLRYKTFWPYVNLTSVVIVFSWLLLLVNAIRFVWRRPMTTWYKCADGVLKKLNISIALVSVIYLLDNVMVALFVQPHFRYFHMTEVIRFMLFSLSAVHLYQLSFVQAGLAQAQRILKMRFRGKNKTTSESKIKTPRDRSILVAGILAPFVVSVLWASTMIGYTRGAYEVQVTSVDVLGDNGEVKFSMANSDRLNVFECKFFKCKIPLNDDFFDGISNTQGTISVNYNCLRKGESRSAKSSLLELDNNDRWLMGFEAWVQNANVVELDCY